jgi:hypothetical protein
MTFGVVIFIAIINPVFVRGFNAQNITPTLDTIPTFVHLSCLRTYSPGIISHPLMFSLAHKAGVVVPRIVYSLDVIFFSKGLESGKTITNRIAGALYHITSRGNAREDIYRDDSDRDSFLELLHKTNMRHGWICHAYCLMSNHYTLAEVGLQFSVSYATVNRAVKTYEATVNCKA